MATKLDELKQWFKQGVAQKATHMIVVCDTFDYDDYPVYVSETENVKEKAQEYSHKPMQKVMEVYNLSKGMDSQMVPVERVYNY